MWDNPTMSAFIVDSKKRIVLPKGQPGAVFDVQQQAEGNYVLVRLEASERPKRMSKKVCLKAIREAPLRPTMDWKKLRELTRDL